MPDSETAKHYRFEVTITRTECLAIVAEEPVVTPPPRRRSHDGWPMASTNPECPGCGETPPTRIIYASSPEE